MIEDSAKLDLTEDNIMKFIREQDYISFAELMRKFKETEGDWYTAIQENIFVWCNMSKKMTEILGKMRSEGKIYYRPSSILIYLVDGMVPDMPIATKGNGYKKPHWLPCTLRTADKIPTETLRFQKVLYADPKYSHLR